MKLHEQYYFKKQRFPYATKFHWWNRQIDECLQNVNSSGMILEDLLKLFKHWALDSTSPKTYFKFIMFPAKQYHFAFESLHIHHIPLQLPKNLFPPITSSGVYFNRKPLEIRCLHQIRQAFPWLNEPSNRYRWNSIWYAPVAAVPSYRGLIVPNGKVTIAQNQCINDL